MKDFIKKVETAGVIGPADSATVEDESAENKSAEDIDEIFFDGTVSVANTVSDGTVKLGNKIANSKTGKYSKKSRKG